jgi:hypothetical protein
MMWHVLLCDASPLVAQHKYLAYLKGWKAAKLQQGAPWQPSTEFSRQLCNKTLCRMRGGAARNKTGGAKKRANPKT